jgi:S-adenosylmethionine-diacylgycerolhomoserine-N-methlytransferase
MSSHEHTANDQPERMERYYRVHAKIYDATRWSFLFGRDALIDRVATLNNPARVLEIGCGTGKNMRRLAQRFPQAQIVGVDAAAAMIAVAQRNLRSHAQQVRLIHGAYVAPIGHEQPFDLVVCSYALTMINPGWEAVLDAARADLDPGGLLAVVDFHDSRVASFKRWMGVNHVRMDAHLLPGLHARFAPQVSEVRRAYGGLWEYCTFIGTT